MSPNDEEIRVSFKGKDIRVSAAKIDGRTIVSPSKWLRVAFVRDEELVEGGVVPDPESFLAKLKAAGVGADVFTFPQGIDEATPKYDFPFEWDNAAAASTSDYEAWWNKLPQETRKNARRSAKKGVTVRVASLDDDFIIGIKGIYDETPVRQGMRFWHYGKDLERIRLENATYPERSEFIGAYYNNELIGFMKWVYVDRVARIMQILAKSCHHDKRPMNAMIAKAIDVCSQKKMQYLVYSKFTFGNKMASDLTEFKRRNGFEKMEFPRYYVPLSVKGSLCMRLGLHRGLLGMLPPRVITFLLAARATVLQKKSQNSPVQSRGLPTAAN